MIEITFIKNDRYFLTNLEINKICDTINRDGACFIPLINGSTLLLTKSESVLFREV